MASESSTLGHRPTQAERDQRIIDAVRAKYDDAFFAAEHTGEKQFVTCDNGHAPAQVSLIRVGALVAIIKVGKCPECGRLAALVDGWARNTLVWQ